jgi:hypothetical protein
VLKTGKGHQKNVFERKTGINIYGDKRRNLENKNKLGHTEYITQGTRKIYQITQIGWYGHTARINNERMPKRVTARMEGASRRGKPRRRWIDKIEED